MKKTMKKLTLFLALSAALAACNTGKRTPVTLPDPRPAFPHEVVNVPLMLTFDYEYFEGNGPADWSGEAVALLTSTDPTINESAALALGEGFVPCGIGTFTGVASYEDGVLRLWLGDGAGTSLTFEGLITMQPYVIPGTPIPGSDDWSVDTVGLEMVGVGRWTDGFGAQPCDVMPGGPQGLWHFGDHWRAAIPPDLLAEDATATQDGATVAPDVVAKVYLIDPTTGDTLVTTTYTVAR